MEDKMIPYYVVEAMMARAERVIKMLVIIIILVITMLVVTNGAWLYCWQQYDYSGQETVTVDGKEGNANYIGNDGEIINGEDSGSKAQMETEEERQEQRNESAEE